MKWRYMKKKFRYNPRRAMFFLFLFLFLVGMSVGFAFLTQTLNIEGVSQMVGATWDIHFENIQVKSGSVAPTTAATITNPTSITFGVTLENPGDFYEFNVDVVNDGTFDAMIDSFSFLPVLTSAQQEFLEYSVTYSNDTELEIYQKLDAGTQETLKVRFGYIDGLDASLYPYVDQELTVEIEIVYVQADENAIDVACSVTCPEGTYLPADSCTCAPCEAGSSCPGGNYTYDPITVHGRSDCPAGTYSLSEAGECTSCPAGSYQDEIGQSSCKVCAAGKTGSVGATSTCTTNCAGYAGTTSWATPSWSNNTVQNHCVATACASGYSLASDNVCRTPYTVTFNYNKATWNSPTTVTRTCTPDANGKCSVTAPGISAISGQNDNRPRQYLSELFSINGWNTNSSATSASYGPTASIEVSGNTTYYAIVTLSVSSVTVVNYSGIFIRTDHYSSSTIISYSALYNCVINNLSDYWYDGSENLWLYGTFDVSGWFTANNVGW